MNPPATELEAAARLAIAALVATGVGVERQWSGHAAGPHARFAGLRTFLLLGLLGGSAGLCVAEGLVALGAAMAAAGMAFAIVAYAIAARTADDFDGTTEAAAITVIALGVLAGLGWLALAAGAGAIIVLALSEKARLHALVDRVGDDELRAGLQFAVLALVVLPLLPEGPFLGVLAIKPRALWIVVLIFTGLNYVGFLARKAVGQNRGQAATGLLGGLISSTALTLAFSRRSRDVPQQGGALAIGVIGACTLLFPRVALVSAALNQDVAMALIPLLLAPAITGAAMLVIGWPRADGETAIPATRAENPLQLWAAIRMALAFQAAMLIVSAARDIWGVTGIYTTAIVVGFSDVDALTAAMSRPDPGTLPPVAAHAITLGILANTALKLGLAGTIGTGTFRKRAVPGLLAIGVAGALSFWLL